MSKAIELNNLRGSFVNDTSNNKKIDEKTDFDRLCLALNEYKIGTKLKTIDLSGKMIATRVVCVR